MTQPAYNGAISPNHTVLPGESQVPTGMKGLEAIIRPAGEKVIILARSSQKEKPNFFETKKAQIEEMGVSDIVKVTERGFEITSPDGKKVVFDFHDYDGELDELMYKYLPTMEEMDMLTGYFEADAYMDIGKIVGLKPGFYPIGDANGGCVGSVSTGGKTQRIRLVVSR